MKDTKITGSGATVSTVMSQIMSGAATPAQTAAFITALRMKGETIDEIIGAAWVMFERSTRIHAGRSVLDIDRDDINIDRETILDVVGTGVYCNNTLSRYSANDPVAQYNYKKGISSSG